MSAKIQKNRVFFVIFFNLNEVNLKFKVPLSKQNILCQR